MTTVPGLDLKALQAFFEATIPGVGRLSAELVHGGRSNLTYRITDGTSTWVLRRPPLGGLTPSAHDMAREYRVIAALAGSGVPVPGAIALCEDPAVIGASFTVVEYVPGMVIRTCQDLHRLSDAHIGRCAHRLIEVLADLHALDPHAVGLAGFGRPQGYLERQVRRWYGQWRRVATRPLADLETLHARLAESRPPESGASIVHGDFRIDNTILDPGDPATVRAVVDWEMSTLGDPLADLGLHLAYADPAARDLLSGSGASTSPRMPAAADLARHYAEVSGRDISNLPFYLALGYFKVAVIAEGIHARYLEGATVGEGFDRVGASVAPLAAAGLAALGRGGFRPRR